VFPYSDYEPTLRSQTSGDLSVALNISFQFPVPEFLIVVRHGAVQRTFVPKTAVDKQGHTLFRKDEIRAAKQANSAPPSTQSVFAQ
jgi:hypothetical protein